jgi:hypothetical protein
MICQDRDKVEALIEFLFALGDRYYKDHPEKRYASLSHGGFYNKAYEVQDRWIEIQRRLQAVERKLDGR